MTLDASGNLLVGKTGFGLATDGVQLSPLNSSAFTANNSVPLYINRRTSDGDLVQFRKDGTTVGSIGTYSGTLAINSVNTGIMLDDTNNTLRPTNGSGGSRDGIISLGTSSQRFKDLYLSGGVVFGTTGGAVTSKTLDDYEEGTWTPAQGSGLTVNGAYSSSGTYTKIGRMVYVKGFVGGATSVSCGQNGQICTGLPFSPNIGGENAGISMDDGRTASRACSALSTSAVQNTSAIPSTPYGISFAITYQSN
jgi:hypothetical protein